MHPELSERTQAVIFVVALGLAIAGLYGWARASQPPSVAPGTVVGVRLAIEGPGWNMSYGPVTTTNNTVYALLLEAAQHFDFSVSATGSPSGIPKGLIVTMINGAQNGQGGLWWQYWVNGVYGDRAADLYALHSGDLALWAFTLSQEGAAA